MDPTTAHRVRTGKPRTNVLQCSVWALSALTNATLRTCTLRSVPPPAKSQPPAPTPCSGRAKASEKVLEEAKGGAGTSPAPTTTGGCGCLPP
eukprot:1187745-Rhodomonas_salina.1